LDAQLFHPRFKRLWIDAKNICCTVLATYLPSAEHLFLGITKEHLCKLVEKSEVMHLLFFIDGKREIAGLFRIFDRDKSEKPKGLLRDIFSK
jgi:hypothetical protein